jgi:hypothetical protein
VTTVICELCGAGIAYAAGMWACPNCSGRAYDPDNLAVWAHSTCAHCAQPIVLVECAQWHHHGRDGDITCAVGVRRPHPGRTPTRMTLVKRLIVIGLERLCAVAPLRRLRLHPGHLVWPARPVLADQRVGGR